MLYGFSNLETMRTYSIELRERNYPTFSGKYNAYIAVFGQLSGDYLGAIETPIATDILENKVPELLNNTDLREVVKNGVAVVW